MFSTMNWSVGQAATWKSRCYQIKLLGGINYPLEGWSAAYRELWGMRASEQGREAGRGRNGEERQNEECVGGRGRMCLCVDRPGMPQPVRGDKSFHNPSGLQRGEGSDSGLEAHQDAFCLAKQKVIAFMNVHAPQDRAVCVLALNLRCCCLFASEETLHVIGRLLFTIPSLISATARVSKHVSVRQVRSPSLPGGKRRPSKALPLDYNRI